MNEATHTPGPWHRGDADSLTVLGPKTRHYGNHLAAIAIVDRTDNESEDSANARLIAAAPDLLTALRDLVQWADNSWCSEARLRPARNAIAKATGE